ncbi:MAG: hypothetical protein IBX50_07710 [Marinospirillum sp.]|uniref:hypothetical protein n=1 Tax=Marinospirillum sp. TaxID=2183934 RepID=UPI0019F17554|nr:hypothetical protein [Marinospirillum sp.]MBE0506593.1 hypothetical protein [Marinospirillum sp.]
MNLKPQSDRPDIDYEHCQTLALALINRAVMDLNSPDSKIRQDAEMFLEPGSAMLHYYVSMIANESSAEYLIDMLREHSQPGSTDAEIVKQRTQFGNRLAQLINAGPAVFDPNAGNPTSTQSESATFNL